MTRAPILAVILRTSGDDWKYQLYSAAYGLEMNIDNDWNARLVLLAPHDYLKAITEDTDVTGDDSAIVSAGVTDIPLDNSEPVISFVKQNHNNWLLVGHPAGNDSDAQINLKLKNALKAGCRVIHFCSPEITVERLALQFQGIGSKQLEHSLIAVEAFRESIHELENIKHRVQAFRKLLETVLGPSPGLRFIIATNKKIARETDLLSEGEVSGFLLEIPCDEYDSILEILAAIDKSSI